MAARPGGQLAAGDRAQDAAGADEAEQALRLARVEQVAGVGPELAHQQDADDRDPQVEGHRHPLRPGPEQPPEDDHARPHRQAGGGDQTALGPAVDHPGVEEQQRVGAQRHQQVDDRQPLGPQGVDEDRLAQGLGGVLEGEQQEVHREQQPADAGLARAQVDGEVGDPGVVGFLGLASELPGARIRHGGRRELKLK